MITVREPLTGISRTKCMLQRGMEFGVSFRYTHLFCFCLYFQIIIPSAGSGSFPPVENYFVNKTFALTMPLMQNKIYFPLQRTFLKLRSELRSDAFLATTIIDFFGIRIHDSLRSNHVFLPLTPTAPIKLTCNLFYNLPLQTYSAITTPP